MLYVISLVAFGVGCYALYLAQSLPCDVNPVGVTWQACRDYQAALFDLGLPLGLYGTYLLIVRIIGSLPYFVLPLLLVRRRSDQLRVLLFATLLGVVGASGTWYYPLWVWAQWYLKPLLIPSMVIGAILYSGYIFGYTFPDGRFVPGWTRWLVAVCVPLAIGTSFFRDSPLNYGTWPFPLPQSIGIGLVATMIYAMVYRYRRVANAIQRQQIKWVVAGVSLLALTWLVAYYRQNIYPALPGADPFANLRRWAVDDIVADSAWYVSQFLFALSVGVSVFRHRLWDIDLVVNRALVYGALTAVLAGLYTASVALSQRIFAALTGSRSDVVFVIATLVVAAAFAPARAYLQRIVDRIVSRERDPAKELAAFGEQVQMLRRFVNVDLLNVDGLLRELVDQATGSFGANGGALRLGKAGQLKLLYRAGEWDGTAALSIPLLSQGEQVGLLELGPRSNRAIYSARDTAVLEKAAGVVAPLVKSKVGGSGR